MIAKKDKNELRMLRHAHVRNKISGTAERPRLCVYRSLQNIYAQLIDDTKGHTLASASTLDKEIAALLSDKDKKSAAKLVGTYAAQRALAVGIKQVVFDRGGYLYSGRVREVAQGARDAGLEF